MSDERQTEARVVMLSLTAIATVLVAARIYTCSVILRRRLYFEEWCILASIIIIWVSTICMLFSLASGMGRHRDELTKEQQISAKFWYLVGTAPSLLGVSLPKISVVNLLCRLFSPAQWHRLLMWSMGILCVVQFIAVSLVIVLGCRPIAASWDFSIEGASCIGAIEFVYYCYYAAAFSAFLDLYLAVYPATQLSRLSCSLKKKVSLSIMLGLGVLSCASAAYKTSMLGLIATEDYTYFIADPLTWTAVEAAVIVMSACIPTLHPLYERTWNCFRRLTTSRRASSYGQRDRLTPANTESQIADSPQKGFWTEKLDSIVSSLHLSSTRSTVSRWTANHTVVQADNTMQTRTLEDAATVTRPPDNIWHTDIVRSPSNLKIKSRGVREHDRPGSRTTYDNPSQLFIEIFEREIQDETQGHSQRDTDSESARRP